MATTQQTSSASSSKQPASTASTKPNRLPAPPLFVGPPSRNASQLSLSRTNTHSTYDPSTRTNSVAGPSPNPNSTSKPSTTNTLTTPLPASTAARDLHRSRTNLSRTSNLPYDNPAPPLPSTSVPTFTYESPDPTTRNNTALNKNSPAPTIPRPSKETLVKNYTSLQNTLDEVELTAQSSTHVFGATHAEALESLRRAQIELARAWGRGNSDSDTMRREGEGGVEREKDDTVGGGGKGSAGGEVGGEGGWKGGGGGHSRKGSMLNEGGLSAGFGGSGGGIGGDFLGTGSVSGMAGGRKRAGTEESAASMALSDESGSHGDGEAAHSMRNEARVMEDETALDIRLASERRAANEAYFKKVDERVRDVVDKLEGVAEAMRSVEAESRSLWSASGSSEAEKGANEKGKSQ